MHGLPACFLNAVSLCCISSHLFQRLISSRPYRGTGPTSSAGLCAQTALSTGPFAFSLALLEPAVQRNRLDGDYALDLDSPGGLFRRTTGRRHARLVDPVASLPIDRECRTNLLQLWVGIHAVGGRLDRTALDYHHETQPMPNPLSRSAATSRADPLLPLPIHLQS